MCVCVFWLDPWSYCWMGGRLNDACGLFMLCTDRRAFQWIATDGNDLISNVIMRINVLISISLRMPLNPLKFRTAPAKPRRSYSFLS